MARPREHDGTKASLRQAVESVSGEETGADQTENQEDCCDKDSAAHPEDPEDCEDSPCASKVQKTVKILQVQHIDMMVDFPVVLQRQLPTIPTVQNTVEVSMQQAQWKRRRRSSQADLPVLWTRQAR